MGQKIFAWTVNFLYNMFLPVFISKCESEAFST